MKTYFIPIGNTPEKADVEILSPELLYTIAGKDCICVVSSGSDTSIVPVLSNAVESNPKAVYGLVGTWVDTDGSTSISNCVNVIHYDRRPNKQRFLNDDNGNVRVHFFQEPCYAFNPSYISISDCLDSLKFSNYLEHAGIERYVVDTKFWNGPRLPGNRLTRATLSSNYFSRLTGVYKEIKRGNKTDDDYTAVVTDRLEKVDYNETELPVVTVVITTHNRTNTALKTIESLVTHLKYPKLHWCICDDRSENGHVSKLADKFAELGVEDVKICRTTGDHWGLGASLNNGLREAYGLGPVALTTEDDWLLTRDLDISRWVKTLLMHDDAGCIRLGFTWERPGVLGFEESYDGLRKFVMKMGNVSAWTLTNQVALRHRRLYDKLGLYKDNCHPDESEGDMRTRFNTTKGVSVFWPSEFPTNTMSDSRLPFLHFGASTIGHDYGTNSEDGFNKPFFRIITPTYNTNDLLIRCARSLDRQTFNNFVWLIVDDCSSDDTPKIIEELAKTRPWIKYRLLKKHVDAGGARNVAAALCDSEYTLYMDSDDIFYDEDSIRAVYETIKRDYPDFVRLVILNNGKKDVFVPRTVSELSVLNQGPPQLCHKTSLQQRFIAHRRKYNDVVWFLRTVDKGSTVSFCPHTFYEYRHDCEFSSHTGAIGKKDPRSTAAAYYLIADLLSEKFNNDYTLQAAKKIIQRFSTLGVVHMSDKNVLNAIESISQNKNSTKTCCMLTLTTPGREWMTGPIFKQNRRMCEEMHIPFIVETKLTHPDRHPSWNKIPLILQYLKRYDTVFWIDDDAVILHPFDIEHLLGDKEVALAEGNMGLNAGVMAFRNAEDSRNLLKWVDTEGYRRGRRDDVWEQNSVIRYVRNILPKNKFVSLDWGEYNASPRSRKIKEERGYLSENTKILHFAGLKKDSQKDEILKQLKDLSIT